MSVARGTFMQSHLGGGWCISKRTRCIGTSTAAMCSIRGSALGSLGCCHNLRLRNESDTDAVGGTVASIVTMLELSWVLLLYDSWRWG